MRRIVSLMFYELVSILMQSKDVDQASLMRMKKAFSPVISAPYARFDNHFDSRNLILSATGIDFVQKYLSWRFISEAFHGHIVEQALDSVNLCV